MFWTVFKYKFHKKELDKPDLLLSRINKNRKINLSHRSFRKKGSNPRTGRINPPFSEMKVISERKDWHCLGPCEFHQEMKPVKINIFSAGFNR